MDAPLTDPVTRSAVRGASSNPIPSMVACQAARRSALVVSAVWTVTAPP